MTRGDSRIAVTVARNSETAKLSRPNRFIIDDPESKAPLSYLLTKPLKLGWSFNGYGAYKFVMQEVNSTEDDNFELQIADYYKYFPRNSSGSSGESGGTESGDGSGSSTGSEGSGGTESGTGSEGTGSSSGSNESGSTPSGSGSGRGGWL